jgi:hypothetical protein
MRLLVALMIGAIGTNVATAQSAAIPKRFGIDADLTTFPQATAKETLASVIKAIERKRIAYLLAHLAEPKFVDQRVKLDGGDFELRVQATTTFLAQEPGTIKDLNRFLSEGEFQEAGDTATVTHKDIKSRSVFLKKIDNRWFLENRIK